MTAALKFPDGAAPQATVPELELDELLELLEEEELLELFELEDELELLELELLEDELDVVEELPQAPRFVHEASLPGTVLVYQFA